MSTKVDVDAILNKAASEPKNKKKSDVPTLITDDKKLIAAIKTWRESKQMESEAKASQKLIAENVLIPQAREFHKSQLKGLIKVPTTIKIESKDYSIQVDVAKKQYSAVAMDDKPSLVEAFGKLTDEFFERKVNIKLTDAAIKDKDILSKLIKAVGAANFQEFFQVEHTLIPTEVFHSARFLDSKVAAKAQTLISEDIIKPYAPAIR